MTERKTVEFDDSVDQKDLADYKAVVERAKQRQGSGGLPLGGAPPLKGTPNLAEAQEQRRQGQQMPEQDRPYTQKEYDRHLQTGQAVPGIGAAYPQNQRTSLGAAPEPGLLREETREGLEALAQAQDAQAAAQQASEGQDGPGAEESGEEGPESVKKLPANLDPEFMQLLMGQQIDQLQRRERRDAIEGRCEKIELRHLLVGKGAQQVVPIIEGVFEPEFRTLNGHEDGFAKRFAWDMCRGDDVSQLYFDTVIGLTNVILSIVSLTGEDVLDHRTKDGEVDEKVFAGKFSDMLQRPFIILFDLWTNYNWFVDRIRDELDAGSLGNG